MKKHKLLTILSSLFLIVGCNADQNADNNKKRIYESIKIDSAVTAYHVGDAFELPEVYANYSQDNKSGQTLVTKKDLEISGYDLTKVGKQTVNVSFSGLSTNYDIYVYDYSEMPSSFKNVEDEFLTVLNSFYDLNKVTEITDYTYSEEAKCLFITGTSLKYGSFEDVVENLIKKYQKEFLQTSLLSQGYLDSGEKAFSICFSDKKYEYDIEFLFVDLGNLIECEADFYVSNKVIEWPKSTVDYICNILAEKTYFNFPELNGNCYSFDVTGLSTDLQAAYVNVFSLNDPTNEYKDKLTKNGYTLFNIPEQYCLVYNNIAVSSDGKLQLEYGYTDGVFKIVFTKPQLYKFDVDEAKNLVSIIDETSTTEIPELELADVYKFFPELYEYASVTAFKAYTSNDKLEELLNSYKHKLTSANWEIQNNGQKDDDGGYLYVSPAKDIKLNVKIDGEDNSIEVIVSKFIDAANGWPAQAIKSLLGNNVTDTIPAFVGNANSYETFEDFTKGIIVYVNNGQEDSSKASYISTIESLGYVYSQEQTDAHWGDPTYLSPNNQICLTIFRYGSGTFTIEIDVLVPDSPEYLFNEFLKEHKISNEKSDALIAAIAGKVTDSKHQRSSAGEIYNIDIDGNFVDLVQEYIESIGCEYDEVYSDWYSETLNLGVGFYYNEEAKVTKISLHFYD